MSRSTAELVFDVSRGDIGRLALCQMWMTLHVGTTCSRGAVLELRSLDSLPTPTSRQVGGLLFSLGGNLKVG